MAEIIDIDNNLVNNAALDDNQEKKFVERVITRKTVLKDGSISTHDYIIKRYVKTDRQRIGRNACVERIRKINDAEKIKRINAYIDSLEDENNN